MHGRFIFSLKPKHKEVLEEAWLVTEIKELGNVHDNFDIFFLVLSCSSDSGQGSARQAVR